MTTTIQRVAILASIGDVVISEHGYDELASDCISVQEALAGIADAEVVEDYPEHQRGPCVLLLQRDQEGGPIHVVWGIPSGQLGPAVLVTVYRPDPELWADGFLRRKQ